MASSRSSHLAFIFSGGHREGDGPNVRLDLSRGRALSRNQSRKTLDHNQVLEQLHQSGISIRVASPKLVTEEAPESYKNVCDVIDTCQDAGISKKVVKLRPIAVIKG